MQAICTKYVGPTNSRGARIIAESGSGQRVAISYPYELSGEAVHKAAAVALMKKLGWKYRIVGGSTKTGYCFVITGTSKR